MNWKPEVFVDGEWGQNSLVFATKEEAENYAHDLYMRWILCSDSRAVESEDPVNYRWEEGKGAVRLE